MTVLIMTYLPYGNDHFTPGAYAHANQNENLMGMKLVENLSTIKQGYFTSGDYTVQSKSLANYLSTYCNVDRDASLLRM